jgi:hypothetical protein
MEVYQNYIYLFICECLLEQFEKSNAVTFSNYCNLLLYSIRDKKFSSVELMNMKNLIDRLVMVFALNDVEINYYINTFLDEKRYLKLEKGVRVSKSVYPFSSKLIKWSNSDLVRFI